MLLCPCTKRPTTTEDAPRSLTKQSQNGYSLDVWHSLINITNFLSPDPPRLYDRADVFLGTLKWFQQNTPNRFHAHTQVFYSMAVAPCLCLWLGLYGWAPLCGQFLTPMTISCLWMGSQTSWLFSVMRTVRQVGKPDNLKVLQPWNWNSKDAVSKRYGLYC